MNISDQLQQICLLLAEDRFVPVLKQMTMSLVTPVESYCISGQQSPHHRGYRHGPSLQEEMCVIWDQRPGKTGSLGFLQVGIQSIQEVLPILVIFEDLSPIDSPEDNVVQGTGRVYP